MHVPGVYQGSVSTVPGFASGPSGAAVPHHSYCAAQPMVIRQPVQRVAVTVPQQDKCEYQQPDPGIVRNGVVSQPGPQVIRPSTASQSQQQEQARAGNNNQGRKRSSGIKQRVIHHRQDIEKDYGYKQSESSQSSNNGQVQGQLENNEDESRNDKGSLESESSQREKENGHFLFIPSLKVPPDVEDLGLVINFSDNKALSIVTVNIEGIVSNKTYL